MRLDWIGNVKDGVLTIDDKGGFRRLLKTLRDGTVRLTISDQDTRTNRQNRYLWGVCYRLLSEHTGHSAEELHEIMKARHARRTYQWDGEEVVGEASTAGMDTQAFVDYVEAVRRDAAGVDVDISDPGEKKRK